MYVITIIILCAPCTVCSYNVNKYRKQGIFTITWTVNEEDEKNQFANIFQVPYMTDCIM